MRHSYFVFLIVPLPTTILLLWEEKRKVRLIVLGRKPRCRERKSSGGEKLLTHISVSVSTGTQL